ncbi:N-acetylneuraminate synthase family protein [Stenotrophomonas sp.]|uniref:N-acetylneuraminate synthase family protein n=2 Tax=Stenotrophomonas sp. TaxID=69392 RepID=UPI0028ACAAD2|nr:N-acetylneuraminate synthase family protein [Stenotrophomonas sp.]
MRFSTPTTPEPGNHLSPIRTCIMQTTNKFFEDLFVLELANNHWGNLARGLEIVRQFSEVVRAGNVRAAIKLQFRDVDAFVHKDYKTRSDIRYVKKTMDTKLSIPEFEILVEAIKASGCIAMATPFDERSVELCEALDFPIIKVASSDLGDHSLIERIVKTGRPTIISTGGANEQTIDRVVRQFSERGIPLAINHCVSLYPSEDGELELNQIDYLRNRYPAHVIGLSTHEYHDWSSSMLMSYAKGARTWERHIDIEADGIPVSSYCTLPHQAAEWFAAYHKAREMCGGSTAQRRKLPNREISYLDNLVRGVYAKRELPAGYVVEPSTFDNDFYMAVPLLKGQLSCREILSGLTLAKPLDGDAALTLATVATSAFSREQHSLILDRGL